MENMEELIDLLVKDESPSQISDAIQDVLFAKSAERIETSRPDIAASLFSDSEVENGEEEVETESEVEEENNY